MAEAERRHSSIPKVLPEEDALEWIAYRGKPLKLPRLDNPSRQLDDPWRRDEKPPQDEQKIDEEYASARRERLVFYQFDQLMKTAAGDEMLVQLKADKLAYFTRPADDLFAELKRGHPSSWGDFRHWSDVRRPASLVHSRIVQDDRRPVDRVFVFDETQLRRIWPAGKRLLLPNESVERFVEGYADNHPKMGADALYNALPPQMRGQIPRDGFRRVVRKPKGWPH